MNKNPLKLDANESAFFKRELEYVKSRTYDTKFKTLKAFDLLPIDDEVPSGATEMTWRRYTSVGFAKIIRDYAKDFPRVDIYGEEETAKVRDLGDSYGYSIKEIRASQLTGKGLEQRRANAARRAIDELLNELAWFGDANYNIQGFINFPGITEYTVPSDGSAGKLWSGKTPDKIVRDVSGLIASVVVPTNGKEMPDTLLLPLEQYTYISDTRMTDGNDKTILTYILENNPFLNTIEWLTELKGAGAGGTDRMMVYPRTEENVTFEIPVAFEQFPEDKQGMEYVIACHAETCGVQIYYPLSVAYGDGI